jgi:hypothetical protein
VLVLTALLAVYIVLGVLYESLVHPLTIISTLPSASVGAMLALMLFKRRSQHHLHHRHRAADRHRQEECHHDDRLRAAGRSANTASPPKTPSSRPACCASGPF